MNICMIVLACLTSELETLTKLMCIILLHPGYDSCELVEYV